MPGVLAVGGALGAGGGAGCVIGVNNARCKAGLFEESVIGSLLPAVMGEKVLWPNADRALGGFWMACAPC